MNLKPPTLLAAAAIIGLVVAACGGVQRDAQPQVRVTAGVTSTPTLVPTYTVVPTAVVSMPTPVSGHTAVPVTVSILAQELADDEMPFDLRFILFGAEETGLNGSYHYVQELGPNERSRIMVMINIDSVGAGDISVLGSERLRRISLESADASDIELVVQEDPDAHGSDHLPFLYAGIDAVFLFADDHTYINSPEDTLQRVGPEPMAQAVAIALEMVNRLVASPLR